MILTKIDLLDEVLDAHGSALGRDHVAYRNHTYRVANLCQALGVEAPEAQMKAAIAAAFHDLGIWTDRTFDYLVPSAKLAQEHLVRTGLGEWGPEIEAMILEHHKLTAAPPAPSALVETFRRADWIDVTFGARSFGPRAPCFARSSRPFRMRAFTLAWRSCRSIDSCVTRRARCPCSGGDDRSHPLSAEGLLKSRGSRR